MESTWKTKAIERRLLNKKLGKRKKELVKSRDVWKDKYLVEKHKACELEKELAGIKKNLAKILTQ